MGGVLAYSTPPDPLAGLKGLSSKGKEGEKRAGVPPNKNLPLHHCLYQKLHNNKKQ